MREFSVKFPAEQNLPLKNFLGTSSRVPLFFAAMLHTKVGATARKYAVTVRYILVLTHCMYIE